MNLINNLKAFLISSDSNNVELGLEILKGQPDLGQEKSVEMILFAVYKLLMAQGNFAQNNPAWKDIRNYLGIVLKEQLQQSAILKKLMNSSLSFGGQSVHKILDNLAKLAKLEPS